MNDIDDLVPHMRRVQSAERDLRDLGVVWQMIESSAAIACPDEVAPILPTLTRTRERFDGHLRAFEQESAPELRNLAPYLARWAFVQP